MDRPDESTSDAIPSLDATDAMQLFGAVPLTNEDLVLMAQDLERKEPLEPTNDTPPQEFLDKERDYVKVGRTSRDVVLSGPIIGGWGPGRYFQNRNQARLWAETKYGAERVQRVDGYTNGRWALLIKNLKEVA